MVHRVFMVTALLALAVPTVATAAIAPVDAASDHAAFVAYHRYLSATVAPSRSAADAFVSSVSSSCPNVLAAVNLLPLNSVNKSALVAFGEEVGGDIAVAASFPPSRGPFAKLARALGRLRWSTSRPSKPIARYVASIRRSFAQTPSDLCGDAQALAASNAQVTPAGTLQWLAGFGRIQTSAQKASAAFIRLLERYQTQADRSLIKANNRLVSRSQSALKSLVATEASKLFAALGLSG